MRNSLRVGRGRIPGPVGLTERRFAWSALAITAVPVLVIARGFVPDMSTAIVSDPGDPMFVFVVLRSIWLTLGVSPGSVPDLPIYFPNVGTLFMSDLLVVPAIAFGVLRTLLGNEMVAFNALVVLCLWFNAAAMAWLMHRWTGSTPAAVASGVLFALSPVLVAQVGHVPLQMAWCLPLIVMVSDRMGDRGTIRPAVLMVAVIALQFLTSTYLAFQCSIVAGLSLGIQALIRGRVAWRLTIIQLLAFGGLLSVTVGPVAWQYYAVSEAQGVVRTVRENVVYSAEPASFLLGDPVAWIPPPRTEAGMMKEAHEKRLWPGWMAVALFLAAIWAWLSRRDLFDPPDATRLATGTIVTVVGIVAALGPFLVVDGVETAIPLPYLAALKGVPGFNSMRVPARFGILMAFGLSLVSGIAVARLPRLLPVQAYRATMGVLLATLVVIVALARPPIPVARIDAILQSPVASVLDSRLGGAVLWYPVHAATADPGREIARMAVNRGLTPMVNGYSGMFPLSVFQLSQLMERGTPAVARDVLVRLGIHHVIFDRATTPPSMLQGWSRLGSGLVTVRVDTAETLFLDLTVNEQPKGSIGMRIGDVTLIRSTPTSVTMHVTNQSDANWVDASATRPQRVEITWQPLGGRSLETGIARAILPMYLERGTSTTVMIPVTPPETPGSYILSVSTTIGAVRKTVAVEGVRANR